MQHAAYGAGPTMRWRPSTGLVFIYEELGVGVVAQLEGFGTSPGCFEGITTFPGSSYLSPYEVCLRREPSVRS